MRLKTRGQPHIPRGPSDRKVRDSGWRRKARCQEHRRGPPTRAQENHPKAPPFPHISRPGHKSISPALHSSLGNDPRRHAQPRNPAHHSRACLGAKLVRPHLRTGAGRQKQRKDPSAVTPTHSDDGVPSSRTWGRVFPSTLSRRHCNATGTWVLFPPQGHYMLCFIWARCSNQCACSSRWGRNNYLFVLPAMEPCGAAATGSGRQSGGALLPRRQGESLLLQPPRQAIDRRLDLKP